MTDPQRNGALVPKWNQFEVGRHLLPVLRYVDGQCDESLSDDELDARHEQALCFVKKYGASYGQLLRVFQTASPELKEKWFGWIECDGELLADAFDFIQQKIQGGTRAASQKSYEKDLYFAGLFRITENGRTVDLAQPFEQYYFCDEVLYKDYLHRRIKLGEQCREWIRRYLPYYTRIRAWYRENGGKESGVGTEYVAYMELLEHFMSRNAYEDAMRDERQALEYERGGLGWFHRARKREIDRELCELSVREMEMKIEDARERYEAYEAQFDDDRAAWLDELSCAPLTAFGRRRELKQKLSELELRLEQYREELGLDELLRKYQKMKRQ